MNKALVNKQTHICENIIVYGPTWVCPDIYEMVDLIPNAGIGWTFENGQWIEPSPPEPVEVVT
jgi:hypothetical protein